MADNDSQTAEATESGQQPAGVAEADTAAQAEAAMSAQADEATTSGGDSLLKPLADESGGGAPRDLDMIMEIPVTLSVQLGQTRLTIRELLDLAKGSIVELDGLAGEPMDILVNGYLIAQGEIVVVDDKYGIRITDIVNRAERIHKLNQ